MLVVAVLVVVTVVYYVYTRRKLEYFVKRDLRLLSSMAKDLESALNEYRGFLRDYAHRNVLAADEPFQRALQNPKELAEFDRQFPRFDALSRPIMDSKDVPVEGESPFSQRIVEVNGDRYLRIEYAARAVEGGPVVTAAGEIKLERLLRHAFRDRSSVFDMVLLARPDGIVFYQAHPFEVAEQRGPGYVINAAERTTGRTSLETRSSDVVIADLSRLQERTGLLDVQPMDIGSIRGLTHTGEVTIAGVSYYLFSQPCKLSSTVEHAERGRPVEASAATPAKAGAENPPSAATAADVDIGASEWILCALVPKTRFIYEALAVSSTAVLIGAVLIVLAFCAWPFANLSVLAERQPLTITEVIMLGTATIIGVSAITLLFCDVMIYRRLASVLDVHLRRTAEKLEEDFQEELDATASLLAVVDGAASTQGWPMTSTGGLANHPLLKTVAPRPNISTIMWLDGEGAQKRSLTHGRVPMPLVNVAEQHYVADALVGRFRRTDDGRSVIVASERSRLTGVPRLVVLTRSHHPATALIGAALPVASLVDPVLGPSTSFVVIDDSGNVLFHGDSERNTRENFFSETDHDRQLRSAVLAHHESFVHLRYWGRDHTAYVRPMRNVPWTLIVFRDERLLRTVNIETVIMTVLCLAIYASVVVAAFLVVIIVYPTYRAPFLWPKPEKGRHYQRLLCLFGLHMVAFGIAAVVYEVSHLLLLTALLPFQALTSAYLVLHRDLQYRRRLLVFTSWIVLQFVFLYVVAHARIEPDLWFAGRSFFGLEERYWVQGVMVLLGVINLLIFVVQEAPWTVLRALWRKLERPVSGHWRRDYMICAYLLLGLTSIVPTIGFFKTAYRFELDALLKHGQLSIADAIQRRAEAVATETIGTPHMSGVMPDFFRTRYSLHPGAPLNAIAPCDGCLMPLPQMRHPVPHFLQATLPQYSEDSVAMRELHHDAMNDGSTVWWGRHPHLRMNKNLPAADGVPSRLLLVLSHIPRVLPSFLYVKDDDAPAPPPLHPEDTFRNIRDPRVRRALIPMNGIRRDPKTMKVFRAACYAAAVFFVIIIIRGVVRQLAMRVFLLDVDEPRWFPVRNRLIQPTLGDHIFLTLRPEKKVNDHVAVDGFQPYDLASLTTKEDAKRLLLAIDQLPSGKHLLLEDASREIDPAAMDIKVEFLRTLLELPNRTIVIASELSPLAILSCVPRDSSGEGQSLHQRWQEVLARFIWFDEEQVHDRVGHAKDEQSGVIGHAEPRTLKEGEDLTQWRRTLARWIRGRRWLRRISPWFPAWETRLRADAVPPLPNEPQSFRTEVPDDTDTRRAKRWRERVEAVVADRHHPLRSYLLSLLLGRLLRYLQQKEELRRHRLPRHVLDAKRWLHEETKNHPFLRQLRQELERDLPVEALERQAVIDEVTERAGNYYIALWENCSDDEKLLLMQLGRDRLINAMNRKVVRRLMARGLIVRDDHVKVFNHTFRVYVAEAAKRDRINELELELERSRWERLRSPLAFVALLVIPLFFVTQKDLFNATTALLTGLAAGLPALVSLVGMMTEKRLASTPKL